jgi:hypothetical protein
MEDRQSAYRILMRKSGGKRPLERPRRRWDVNLFASGFKWQQSIGYDVLSAEHLNFCARFTKIINFT